MSCEVCKAGHPNISEGRGGKVGRVGVYNRVLLLFFLAGTIFRNSEIHSYLFVSTNFNVDFIYFFN